MERYPIFINWKKNIVKMDTADKSQIQYNPYQKSNGFLFEII